MAIDTNKPIDNSRYDYAQSNPLASENPCPIPREMKQLGKGRGLTVWDLLKERPTLKVKRTQKEIQECCRPSFDHPKILHILIDRAKGFGCKTLAKRHGGSNSQISKFCQSMGFDVIKPEDIKRKGPDLMKEAVKLMHYGLLCDQREVAKYDEQMHWAGQKTKEYCAWKTLKQYHADPEAHRERRRKWREANKEKLAEWHRKYREANKEKLAEWHRKYREANKEELAERRRKYQKKPINKIRHNIRRRLREYVKSTGANWGGFGCTSDELREHLERQFTKRMTWENYGTYWHVDHVRPLASFDLFNQDQRRAANHYTNLQPLEAKKNVAKSDEWDGQLDMAAQLL